VVPLVFKTGFAFSGQSQKSILPMKLMDMDGHRNALNDTQLQLKLQSWVRPLFCQALHTTTN